MGRASIPRCAAIGRAWLLNRHRQLQCLVKSRCRGSTNPCRGWTEAERSIAHPNSIPPDITCCYCNAAEWAAPPTPQDHNHNFSLDSTPGLNRKRAWSVRNSNLPKPTQPAAHGSSQTQTIRTNYQNRIRPVVIVFCLARVDSMSTHRVSTN